MEDIRLKPKTFLLDGKRFELCATFNTLADIEEAFGSLGAFLRTRSLMKGCRVALASMMNDYAEAQGWPERYTPTQAGRLLPTAADEVTQTAADILGLVREAILPAAAETETQGAEEPGKKEKARRRATASTSPGISPPGSGYSTETKEASGEP